MPLMINKAEQILGESRFSAIMSKLFRRYKAKLTYDDFLRECKLTKEAISVD
jgi:hypothetical protein